MANRIEWLGRRTRRSRGARSSCARSVWVKAGVAKSTSKMVSMWRTGFDGSGAVRILGRSPRLTFRAFTFNIKIMHFSNATPF